MTQAKVDGSGSFSRQVFIEFFISQIHGVFNI